MMVMKFNICERGKLVCSFEDEMQKGLDRLMLDIVNYRLSRGNAPWGEMESIYNEIKNGRGYYKYERYWVMRGMSLREFCRVKGMTHDECVDIASGRYFKDYIEENFDGLVVKRYVIYADMKFRDVEKLFEDAYAKDNSIMDIYDWLDEKATPEEIERFVKPRQ